MNQRTRQSGFTSVEMAISGIILTLVLGSVGYAMQRSLQAFEQSQASADLNSRAARTMQRIVSEVMGARQATLVLPAPPFSTDNIQFERSTGIAAGAPVYGPLQGIALDLGAGEIDNDLDDDGDGLIDERAVVLVTNPGAPDEIRTVIANGVPELLEGELPAAGVDENGNGLEEEAGLAFSLEDSRLTIRLTLQRSGPGGALMTVTQVASVIVRNQWEP